MDTPTHITPGKATSAATMPVSTPKTPETVLELAWEVLIDSVKKVANVPTGPPLDMRSAYWTKKRFVDVPHMKIWVCLCLTT
mmetsp:Transcript_86344/g.143635  ORF Transcript_86344/g.143635 Transcript_86344/m.143635 type:complete len:82 (-) Transcript_86344:21-266(-)